ncbi:MULTISPECIES: hypothetical protein [Streptomyces]|uniref:hypothetical protein n=1 Tax=Streptomyces TaxID=1883 RepID=UPI0015870506|nr:hypothetical protein [Streptomyces sp. CAI-85]MBO7936702.1 hypothetical protein [Streptomyces sp. S9]NUV61112.1 hypothetical protein [Streptomyces sp. CAI-85]
MKLRHSAAWVSFTAAALMATSACAGSGAATAGKAVDDIDMAALSRTTVKTENRGSAQVTMVTDNGTGPVTMEGTYSWGSGVAFDVKVDAKAVQMQALTKSAKIRMLLVGGNYYYDIDPQPSGPLKGKEWMKIDGSAVKSGLGFGGGSGDPLAYIKSLRDSGSVKDLGKEIINGQSTTHYRAVIQPAGANGTVTMDLWVNAQDLPVRTKQSSASASVTTTYRTFGATASIKAPPAAETGNLTKEVKKLQQQQG